MEYKKEGIIYELIGKRNGWKVMMKKKRDERVWVKWKEGGLIVKGRG